MKSNLDYTLHLFLSVDLVGSTAYKSEMGVRNDGERKANGQKIAKLEDGPPAWIDVFNRFYKSFPSELFYGLRQKARSDSKFTLMCKNVGLWKCLGDELIFVAEVQSNEELALYIEIFCSVLESEEESMRELSKQKIRLKGSAWLASSPLPNLITKIGVTKHNKVLGAGLDFVGPEIDAGFRMAKAAKEGFLIVSLELAELLITNQRNPRHIYHVGWETFKGVLADKPYPILWIPFRPNYTDAHKEKAHAPWAGHLCHFTKEFLAKPNITEANLLELTQYFRSHHQKYRLFKKEFVEKALPKHIQNEIKDIRRSLSVPAEPIF